MEVPEIRRGTCLVHINDDDNSPVIIKELPEDKFEAIIDDGYTHKVFTLQELVLDYIVVGQLDETELIEYK